MVMVQGCEDCRRLTSGVCPLHAPIGVYDVMRVQQSVSCAEGVHVWMPWLGLPEEAPTRYVTYCIRCRHHEQYDL